MAMVSLDRDRNAPDCALWDDAHIQTIAEDGHWRVTCRINKANNLTLEIEHDGALHAEVILQEGGIIDLGTKARPWELGQKGWGMPGAPSTDMRKYRFAPSDSE